ncbi:MAG: MBL fold metallo-hydrolase [Paludibacteraceae bacterium]|nr:MBL fold metallo-hydrolase [Paludibacteraceae bacterium]
MKTIQILFLCMLTAGIHAQSKISFSPLSHASFAIQAPELVIYVDPVGDATDYARFPTPDIILITHAHGDHFNASIIKSVTTHKTKLVANRDVVEKLGYGHALKNGEIYFCDKIKIEAIAAYNTTAGRENFHPAGVGNGYVLNIGKERVYISGDTEDIPEMRKLKNIDHAFVCMNLPYTMSVERAASAVSDFKPRNLYPYHYRNQDGTFSDVQRKLKTLLSKHPKIKIHYAQWYR